MVKHFLSSVLTFNNNKKKEEEEKTDDRKLISIQIGVFVIKKTIYKF